MDIQVTCPENPRARTFTADFEITSIQNEAFERNTFLSVKNYKYNLPRFEKIGTASFWLLTRIFLLSDDIDHIYLNKNSLLVVAKNESSWSNQILRKKILDCFYAVFLER